MLLTNVRYSAAELRMLISFDAFFLAISFLALYQIIYLHSYSPIRYSLSLPYILITFFLFKLVSTIHFDDVLFYLQMLYQPIHLLFIQLGIHVHLDYQFVRKVTKKF